MLSKTNRLHFLKCLPEYFDSFCAGHKPFEIRKNDRSFLSGDLVCLLKWSQSTDSYMGSYTLIKIGYLYHLEKIGLTEWVAFECIPIVEALGYRIPSDVVSLTSDDTDIESEVV